MKACFVNILLYIGNKSLEGFVLIICEHAIIIIRMSILTVKFDVVGM